jgi:hypothetical protein
VVLLVLSLALLRGGTQECSRCGRRILVKETGDFALQHFY